EERPFVRAIELRQPVPRGVVARQQEPRPIAFVTQRILQLKCPRADVAELAAGKRARDAAERFRARRERHVHLLHASARHELREERRRRPLIAVHLHVIRAKRVDDEEDDVRAARAGDVSWVGRLKYSIALGDRMTTRGWLEGVTDGTKEAGEQLVLPEQVVALTDSPCDRRAEADHRCRRDRERPRGSELTAQGDVRAARHEPDERRDQHECAAEEERYAWLADGKGFLSGPDRRRERDDQMARD